MRVYYDRDADLNLIKGKKVAIIGYGSQGHAHALNLRDSGVKEVAVALRKTSAGVKKAEGEKFKVMEAAEAAKWADVMMMLTPDELQADIYNDHLAKNMKEGAALMFAHGLNVHFNLIEPRADLDVMMIAPKGPGHTVRSEYAARRRRALPAWRCTRTLPATRMTCACPMARRSAAAAPASSRPPSRRNARPTCSASRPCCAAAWSN